jgi:hypothetical protein
MARLSRSTVSKHVVCIMRIVAVAAELELRRRVTRYPARADTRIWGLKIEVTC